MNSSDFSATVAAVFPGQGSQSVGMGKSYYDEFKEARATFEEASDALSVDMAKLCFEGPDEALQLTENTQPAILTASTALFRVLEAKLGFVPKATSGHSVGEYGALVSSGVLSFGDAVRAVRARGRAMQRAVPVGQGAMAAVMGLTEDQLSSVCERAVEVAQTGPLSAANYNAPGQIVVSGSKGTLDWLKSQLTSQWLKEEFGIDARPKLIPLAVSAPFHCELMRPAEEEMAILLKQTQFSSPKFPVVQNTTAQAAESVDQIRDELIKQISRPVRWVDCQHELLRLGARAFVEVGSGKVLAGLAKKTLAETEDFKMFNLNSVEELKLFESQLN